MWGLSAWLAIPGFVLSAAADVLNGRRGRPAYPTPYPAWDGLKRCEKRRLGGGLARAPVKMLVSMQLFLLRMHYSGAVWPD
jgi:hypothetical protein